VKTPERRACRVATLTHFDTRCDIHFRAILTLRSPRQRRVPSNEARIIARQDALRRNRGSEEQLGQLIQEELDRTPARERDELLDYFEHWLDRQCLTLLEEWSPKSRMVQ
jgi:hypothetical protein